MIFLIIIASLLKYNVSGAFLKIGFFIGGSSLIFNEIVIFFGQCYCAVPIELCGFNVFYRTPILASRHIYLFSIVKMTRLSFLRGSCPATDNRLTARTQFQEIHPEVFGQRVFQGFPVKYQRAIVSPRQNIQFVKFFVHSSFEILKIYSYR